MGTRSKTQDKMQTGPGWLTGQLLVAMPSMSDPRFERTVLLLCSHGPEGAMGLVLNRLYGELSFNALLTQLKIAPPDGVPEKQIHYGGPVDPVRGFVVHSTDYMRPETTQIAPGIALTATIEVLQALAEGRGPEQAFLALGYAGWSPGQLESEIQANGWLLAPPNEGIIFDSHHENKWSRAFDSIGIAPSMISGEIGHA